MAAKTCFAACIVLLIAAGEANAESFLTTPTREVGPYISGQATPAPNGGWQQSDDRTLNASIDAQGGWQISPVYTSRVDQEIATGVAHSGGHSWRLSNWFHNGYVNPILSPQFSSVGESTATNNDGSSLGGAAKSHHVVYDFWFRSASVQSDPGSAISTTISDAPGDRMTYLGIFDEVPGPGSGATDGCPTDTGCFHVDAVEVTSGKDAADDGDATFVDHYSPPLTRGVWYRAHIDATFVDGPGAVTTDPGLCPNGATCHTGNDLIHYEIFDGTGNIVFDTGNIGSWEAAYYDGTYNSPGTVVASDYIGFRDSSNADNGTQQPFDTYSVTYRPHGVYFDDMSVVPDVGTGFATSFDFDRYVAKSGSDTTDCSVQANPCLTIAYALTQSNPYDTIHVAAGVYAERSSASTNLNINMPVAIEGAQVGVDARTRDVGGGADGVETIIVPGVEDNALTLGTLGESAVVSINAAGVSLDGLIIDGDNTSLTSPITLNGANPDADSGIFATGSNITVQNTLVRNVGGSGIFAFMNSGSGGDNLIQFNRFTNITNPSTWGIGIYAGYNFYAQISDNLMDQVRVGIQTENNQAPDPGMQAPAVLRNEIHATRIGLFHNLFYQAATTYTLAANNIIASLNAGQSGQWNGIEITSMQDAQTVIVSGNSIDGGALAGNRSTVGYLLTNWSSSQSAATAIDGGSVGNVDVGLLATDNSYYGGPVQGALATNIAFGNVDVGAVYIEDTNEQTGSAAVTIGSGNTYAAVTSDLVLSGTAPAATFAGGVTGVASVLVRSARNYYFGGAGSMYGPCNATPCTVANASINAGVAAANPGGTVYIEQGTFDEMGVIGTGKDNLRLTAADPSNRPTLTRLSGGPNQPVLVVAGTPFATPGAAPKGVVVDHLDFAVDKKFAAEGLLVSGFVDGMSILSNQFVQSASATSGTASYKYTNAISINIDPQHNSLALPRVDGSNVTILNNAISGSSTPNAAMFRAGIAVDGSVGTISGNASAGLNHDAIVRFATTVTGGTNGWAISGNTFSGGGLEFDAPNAGVTPIAIAGNMITAASQAPSSLAPALGAPQTGVEADFSVLRLIDNFQNLPVTVSGNTFAGYANGLRGALVENFPNATFSSNTFTPLNGAADFVSLVVSNKEINTNNPPEPPYPMAFTALQNTFNGSGVNGAGRAAEFIDDNDANGTSSFGAISFGDNTAANANMFDPNLKYYFNLVDQNCDTAPSGGDINPPCTFLDYNDAIGTSGTNTQVRPFRGNVYAVNNLFGGVAPRAMSPVQQAALNAQTNDIKNDATLGYVDYGLYGVVLAINGPVANVQAAVPTDYSAVLANTGNALPENVLVQLSVSRIAGIQSGDIALQYDTGGGNYQTIALASCSAGLCGSIGGAGFPVGAGYNATIGLRSTFAVADTFTVQAVAQGMTSSVIYAADTHSTQVVRSPADIGLNLMGPQTATAGTTVPGYSARLTNTGGAAGENVLVHFVIGRPGDIGAGDLALQYYNGSTYQTIPLSACGSNLCGTFGPQPGGFPVGVGYDVTSQLQISYVKSGVFSVNASVDGVTSSMSYATAALAVTVAPGAAANIAANGSTSLSGAAGTGASPLPSVQVTDQFGNPVPGYVVHFAAAQNSGTLSASAPTTDANGIATLGGWSLGTASPETVTAASGSGLAGAPVTFTATVSTSIGVAVNFPPVNREYVQYGKVLDYTIVASNNGPSTANNVAVTDVLPPELDAANATWICYPNTAGASCGASSGTGDLSDIPTIPSAGSVTYVISATVLDTAANETIANQASIADGNTATWATQIVIFRDGFETGGDTESIGTLDDVAMLTLAPAQALRASAPDTWIRAVDAHGREVFRIEALRAGGNILVQIVTTDANGHETPGSWMGLGAQPAGLALADTTTSRAVIMVGAGSSGLQAAIESWAVLPLQIYASQ
ncbi:MAG: Ig-like domain-containing protein [Rudaea sp.]|nr:Ig-like domain-containing protein [Rudaea sp.]